MSVKDRTRDREYVEEATRRFREALAARVDAHSRAGHEIREVLGEPDELASRAVQATVPEASPWDEIVGPFTRTDGAQARLGGISRQAVASKAARRRLLRVVTADGVHLFPVWQFTTAAGVLPGLPEVLSLFRGADIDDWTLAGWLRTPDPELGESPCDALLRGQTERVLTVARTARRSLAA